jgi:hypothetical protein
MPRRSSSGFDREAPLAAPFNFATLLRDMSVIYRDRGFHSGRPFRGLQPADQSS